VAIARTPGILGLSNSKALVYTGILEITRSLAMVSPEAVLDYCQTHSTIEAARHFGISDSYIRRIKRGHKREVDPDIATDDTQWTCPFTGEVFPIVPGTHRAAWEVERKSLHYRHVVMLREAEQEAEQKQVPDDVMEGGTEAEQAELELESEDHVPDVGKMVAEPVSELPSIPSRVERVIVVKRYQEPTDSLVLAGMRVLSDNFHMVLALLITLSIVWSMSTVTHSAVLFR
jgi:hypothetical protein